MPLITRSGWARRHRDYEKWQARGETPPHLQWVFRLHRQHEGTPQDSRRHFLHRPELECSILILTSSSTPWQANLTTAENSLLASDTWGISDIVIWEISKLVQLRRIVVDLNDPVLTRLLSSIQIWPIT